MGAHLESPSVQHLVAVASLVFVSFVVKRLCAKFLDELAERLVEIVLPPDRPLTYWVSLRLVDLAFRLAPRRSVAGASIAGARAEILELRRYEASELRPSSIAFSLFAPAAMARLRWLAAAMLFISGAVALAPIWVPLLLVLRTPPVRRFLGRVADAFDVEFPDDSVIDEWERQIEEQETANRQWLLSISHRVPTGLPPLMD